MESLDNQDIQESIQDTTPLEKAKKPRSEKQMENFKKLQEKRKEAIEKKKLEKKIEASKLLLEQDQRETGLSITPPAVIQKKKTKELAPPPSEDEEESDSSVEKIIVNVKNKKKTKKKAKEIIIYNDEDSESEEEEEEQQEYQMVQGLSKQPKRILKTQQNKKSKTKIYQQEQPQMFKSQAMNYFVD